METPDNDRVQKRQSMMVKNSEAEIGDISHGMPKELDGWPLC